MAIVSNEPRKRRNETYLKRTILGFRRNFALGVTKLKLDHLKLFCPVSYGTHSFCWQAASQYSSGKRVILPSGWEILVQFSCSVVSDSLRPHEPQHARPPCPSPTPKVHPNPCPLSRWCHPTISSSEIPFSSCSQSFPASGLILVRLFDISNSKCQNFTLLDGNVTSLPVPPASQSYRQVDNQGGGDLPVLQALVCKSHIQAAKGPLSQSLIKGTTFREILKDTLSVCFSTGSQHLSPTTVNWREGIGNMKNYSKYFYQSLPSLGLPW